MKKILIFTAGFGEGHNSAARGVEAAVNHIAPDGGSARVIDLFSESYGPINDFCRKTYIGIINRAPKLWQHVYEWLDNAPVVESNLGILSKACKRLEQILEQEKPDAVVSVYPAYGFLFNKIYNNGKRRPFSLVTVVTDSITINSVWYRAGSDYFIVPNEDTARVLRERGVPDDKIKAFGFPVTHQFSTAAVTRQPPTEGNRRVLFMINSAVDQAPNLVRHLLRVPGIQLTVTVGRNEELRAAVEKAAAEANQPVEIHGWTQKLPFLLMSHHILISKAGGATVQETIAAKTPMLIMQVVPGQEEGNARLLLDHDCAALTETPEAVAGTIGELFNNGTELWNRWEQNITRLSKPDAALVIARFLLELKHD